jgi:hypothetical protein
MTNTIISFKQIRAIQWKTFYIDLLRYLQTGQEPKKMSKSSLYRFRKRAELFHLNPEEGKEEILFTTDLVPDELKGIDDKILQPERVYKVVAPNEKDQLILAVYRAELGGGFRGVLSLYRKISAQYIGITRADISKVLSKLETKQLHRPVLGRTITPITEQRRPMDMLQIDLVD